MRLCASQPRARERMRSARAIAIALAARAECSRGVKTERRGAPSGGMRTPCGSGMSNVGTDVECRARRAAPRPAPCARCCWGVARERHVDDRRVSASGTPTNAAQPPGAAAAAAACGDTDASARAIRRLCAPAAAMNPEKLAKMAAQVRTGGKGSVRRKKKAIHKTTTTDDKRLQNTLKRLGVNNIPAIEEVNLFKDNGTVIHFNNPKGAQRALPKWGWGGVATRAGGMRAAGRRLVLPPPCNQCTRTPAPSRPSAPCPRVTSLPVRSASLDCGQHLRRQRPRRDEE